MGHFKDNNLMHYGKNLIQEMNNEVALNNAKLSEVNFTSQKIKFKDYIYQGEIKN